MYSRLLEVPEEQSFFLFGPRGTGKTAWLRKTLGRTNGDASAKKSREDVLFFDLLDHATYLRFQARPESLADEIPARFQGWVVLDEVQRVPEVLNEVHRLIERRRLRFALTGSSARKLRRRGVNLLAGRAVTRHMHPLVAEEMGRDWSLRKALEHGTLPFAYTTKDPDDYLSAYAATYLREEVLQEGFVRNIGAFGRFLEVASFSQGCVLNMAAVARDAGVQAKLAENYFQILEDLLLAVRVPAFTRRAKRRVTLHPKFYYFDAGLFRSLRPQGPLDSTAEILGPALETLVFSHIRAINDYRRLGYGIHYWRTPSGSEVDFVLYGPAGLHAIEVKLSGHVRSADLDGLRAFLDDFPKAKAWLLYPGTRAWHDRGIEIVPAERWLSKLSAVLR